jgi:predicted Zn-dependent protease
MLSGAFVTLDGRPRPGLAECLKRYILYMRNKPRMPATRFLLLIPLALALAGFAQDQPVRIPGAGINSYSLDKEIALGAQLAEDVRRESKALDSDLVQDYAAHLGSQLALGVAGPNFTYAFTVMADLPAGIVDGPTHEPMALPGGPIFVPSSLILEAQNTAELAGMLAHAIAHVAARQCTRSKTRADLMQIVAMGPSQSYGCWAGQATAVPLEYLAFQRAFERQDDYYAVQIMAKAGYDPAALAAYIRRVRPAPGRQGPISGAFSPWPAAEERVKQIGKEIGKLPPGRTYSAGEDIKPIQLALRSRPAK